MLPGVSDTHREVFENFASWMVTLFYTMAAVAVALFLLGIALRVRKFLRGHGRVVLDHPVLRLRRTFVEVASNSKVGRRDVLTRLAHLGIMWGFIALFIGTVIVTIDFDFARNINPRLRFWNGGFYLAFKVTLDTLGAAFLLGLGAMMVRRWVIHPWRLRYDRVDRPAGGYDRTPYRRRPLRQPALRDRGHRLPPRGLPARRRPSRLRLLLAARLDDRPGTGRDHQLALHLDRLAHRDVVHPRHPGARLHRLHPLQQGGAHPRRPGEHLPPRPAGGAAAAAAPRAGDERGGARGRPAGARHRGGAAGHRPQLEGAALPRRLHQVRALPRGLPGARERRPALPPRPRPREFADRDLGVDGLAAALTGRTPFASVTGTGANGGDRTLPGNLVDAATLWSCTTCRACVEVCPVGIEHVPMIIDMRRALVDSGDVDPKVQKVFQNLDRYGNSFGQPERNRGRWTKELDEKPKDARKEPVDVLWVVGDYASFDPRCQEATRALARVLTAARVDFGILYEGEHSAGNDVRRVGEEGLWEALAQHNIETLGECD